MHFAAVLKPLVSRTDKVRRYVSQLISMYFLTHGGSTTDQESFKAQCCLLEYVLKSGKIPFYLASCNTKDDNSYFAISLWSINDLMTIPSKVFDSYHHQLDPEFEPRATLSVLHFELTGEQKIQVQKQFDVLLVSTAAHFSRTNSNSNFEQLQYVMANSDFLQNFAKMVHCYIGPEPVIDVSQVHLAELLRQGHPYGVTLILRSSFQAYRFWILRSLCQYLLDEKIDQSAWTGDLVAFHKQNAANFNFNRAEIRNLYPYGKSFVT